MLTVNLPVDIAVVDKTFQVINFNEIRHLIGMQSLHEHYYHLYTSRYILHARFKWDGSFSSSFISIYLRIRGLLLSTIRCSTQHVQFKRNRCSQRSLSPSRFLDIGDRRTRKL